MKKIEKNSGFTLVELLAVIVLLTIILTIAVVSVSSIRYKVASKQYQNLASTIETAAEKYSSETGVKKMFVQTLIDQGLLESDDETSQIRDPRDKSSSLNCKTVTIDSAGEASLGEEDTKCDVSLLSDEAIRIKYCLASERVCTPKDLPKDYNHWFKDDVILSVAAAPGFNLEFDENTTYSWISPLAPDEVHTDKDLKVASNYVNDTYQVTVNHDGQDYTAIAPVRIDQVPPRVFDIVDKNPQSWNRTKSFTFKLTDNESGIDAYAFGTSRTEAPTSGWNTVPSGSEKAYTVDDDTGKFTFTAETGATIYIWVRDKVGNTNSSLMDDSNLSGVITIKNIDLNIDSVEVDSDYKLPYYRNKVVLTGKAKDEKSGLVAYAFTNSPDEPTSDEWKYISGYNASSLAGTLKEVTYTHTVTANDTYYFWVKDAAGTAEAASIDVDNIDTEIDYIYVENTQSEWVSQSKLVGTISDNLSGVIAYAFTDSSSAPSSGQWKYLSGYNASSKLGRRYDAISVEGYANTYGYWYLWVKDAAGNEKYVASSGNGSVYVNNVGRKLTKTINFYSTSNYYISDNSYIQNLKAIESVTLNSSGSGGYVSTFYPNGNYAYVEVYAGNSYTYYYNTTCYDQSYLNSYSANARYICTYGYCPYGGSYNSSTGMCTGTNYVLATNNGAGYYTTCSGVGGYAGYNNCAGSTYTSCQAGYTRPGGADQYSGCSIGTSGWQACNNYVGATIPCGASCTAYTCCHAQCIWSGNYYGTCMSGYTQYSCNSGSQLDGSTCYYCYYGSISGSGYSRTCGYACSGSYLYWQASATMTYVVSP